MLMTALLHGARLVRYDGGVRDGRGARQLAPDGEVTTKRALGGQAIRENAAEFCGRRYDAAAQSSATRRELLDVDDDSSCPSWLDGIRQRASPQHAQAAFVRRWGAALRKNLAYVAQQAAPYARDSAATAWSASARPGRLVHPGVAR